MSLCSRHGYRVSIAFICKGTLVGSVRKRRPKSRHNRSRGYPVIWLPACMPPWPVTWLSKASLIRCIRSSVSSDSNGVLKFVYPSACPHFKFFSSCPVVNSSECCPTLTFSPFCPVVHSAAIPRIILWACLLRKIIAFILRDPRPIVSQWKPILHIPVPRNVMCAPYFRM